MAVITREWLRRNVPLSDEERDRLLDEARRCPCGSGLYGSECRCWDRREARLVRAEYGGTGTGDGTGEELHAWGDLLPDTPDDDVERYPAEEGPEYRGRDTMYSIPSSDSGPRWVDTVDVGELIGLDDLMHQSGEGLQPTQSSRRKTESRMTPQEFVKFVEDGVREAGDEGHEREHRASGMSPSRSLHNVPQPVIDEARTRLEHRAEDMGDGVLSREDEANLKLLEDETSERRGLSDKDAARKTAETAEQKVKAIGGEKGEKKPEHEASEARAEMEEDEALERIEDALDELDEMSLAPDAEDEVDEIDHALDDLFAIQDEEEGGKPGAHAKKDDDADDKDDEHGNPFAKESARDWGEKLASAMQVAPVHASEPEPVRVGFERTAAEELPFDVFGGEGSAYYTQAERSIASATVNRLPEQRMRFAPPSGRLIDAAADVLKRTLAALRRSYSLEHYDLQRVVPTKVAHVDGSIVEGRFEWHVILADHLRNRRGELDLVLAVVGGRPEGDAMVYAGGRAIPLTRDAIDRHLNVRRDATRSGHRVSDVELSNHWEA